MRFLIPTEPDDTHAILVTLALEEMGYVVTPLFTADYPTQQKNSVFIEMTEYKWKSVDDYSEIINNHYDVVWWRRARKPYIPKKSIHADDYTFVCRENILFFESFTSTLAPNAWWINSKESANRANFKLLQLKIASECGFVIPSTLCSNDPQEIKQFLIDNEHLGVIYKPMCSHFWHEVNQTKVAYTARVNTQQLPHQHVLQKMPGIFQVEMKKAYELRITCFGNYIVAAKLNSQQHADGIVDWRAIRRNKMIIEPYELPESIAHSIRLFMHRLGIVFGSFDFIVTPEGEYVFLEVNEQGQFLWIEEYHPHFKMLDIFIQFIVNGSIDFHWEAEQFAHSIERYRTKMQSVYHENMKRHVQLNTLKKQT